MNVSAAIGVDNSKNSLEVNVTLRNDSIECHSYVALCIMSVRGQF